MAPDLLTDIEGKEGSLKVLLLGDARGDLPGVRKELEAIIGSFSPLRMRGYLQAKFLLGKELTVPGFKAVVSSTRYTIIHYAGHTLQNGLVLPFADADLETTRFLAIVKQNPPTLLVMDACNSLGDPEDLDLMTPLCVDSGAIFAIGTSSVVCDDLPAEAFPIFYAGLIRGRPIGLAFNDAERQHRGYLRPYFLLGDPSLTLR
jgi:CHAT domain-containing protein